MRASSHYYYYPTWAFLIFAIPISYCGYEPDDHHSGGGGGGGGGSSSGPGRVELTGLYPGPYFDLERNQDNVSAHVGTHAYLPCYVKQLGNKSVSWIRKEDSHIVTVDRYTFIADDRFQVMAAPPGDSWMLQIKYVQPRDAGLYECQISTEPKMAHRIRLNVLVPKIRMDTTEENMFVWEGSQVQLRCVVMNTLADNVGKVIWLRNGKILNKFDLTTSSTTLSFQAKLDGTKLTETLTFVSVQKADGGNYTCSLENVGSSSVTLHVLSGENPAAMHHGRGITTTTNSHAASVNNFHHYYFNRFFCGRNVNSLITNLVVVVLIHSIFRLCHR